MFDIKYNCHICLIFVSSVPYILRIVLTVNPSTYVEQLTF